jgi:hypothetical protein
MPPVISRRRRVTVAVATTAVASAAAALSLAAPTVASASTASTHAYRHGLVPTYQPGARDSYNGHTAGPGSGGSKALHYGGGVGGVGVTSGQEQVYLVFWGSQWSTSDAVATRTQNFFSGIGTNNEGWSRVMADYCEGVTAGSTTCPSSAPHVAYPASSVLAGVWFDNTSAAPSQASEAALVAEANRSASHFANSTPASNRYAQYVILSPHGTHPDGFNTSTANWCAWHDYTGDSSLGGTVGTMGPIAFTNDPYLPDAGTSCGQGFVNGSAGTLDGISIVYGHEYAETITDQFPAGGWTDTSGAENADKCAWISPGRTGGAGNITLSTGSFPVQSTWSNLANSGRGGCVLTK